MFIMCCLCLLTLWLVGLEGRSLVGPVVVVIVVCCLIVVALFVCSLLLVALCFIVCCCSSCSCSYNCSSSSSSSSSSCWRWCRCCCCWCCFPVSKLVIFQYVLRTAPFACLPFWGHICNKNRPKLKKVGPQFQPDEDVQMEEMSCLRKVYGFRRYFKSKVTSEWVSWSLPAMYWVEWGCPPSRQESPSGWWEF